MASQSLPTLEKQVRLDNTVGNAPFAQSFDNAALNSNALAQFGSNLAITASTTLAQKRGYEAGLNPHGNLTPALTQTDRAYQDAYITQAQNTLGLQATKLMQEGQSELTKAWKLTPDMIASYTKNMSEGLNDIINNAPMQAQPGLAAQFNSSLMNSTGNLNQKMIGQQKQEALQNATLFNNSQLAAIYESSRGGDIKSAEKMQFDMEARTNSMLATGMISPLQAEASKKSARMSLYTGLYTGEAIKAFNNKEDDQFLADMLAKKPEGMNTLEWESIAKNVMQEVQVQESFKQRNETSLYSEANRLLNEGGLTSDFIAQLESETSSKPKFNNFMAQVATYQRKNHGQNQKVMSLMPLFNNSDAMAIADNKTKNLTLIQAGQDVQQRAASLGRTLDDFEAQTEAMSAAATPVQSYTQKLNAGFMSGNPQLMMRNLNAYRALNNSNAKVLSGVSAESRAMMTKFESQIENGNEPDIAAQNATDIVLKKSNDQMEVNTALITDWERKNANTPSRLNSWASQFSNLAEGTSINNLPAFAIHAKNIFKSNMALLNGDVEGATKMTREGIARTWGVTAVNGNKEFVFQPVEKTIGLDEGAAPLIKHDLYEQLKTQIEPMNAAYDEGVKNKDMRISFKYELDERPSYVEFRKAQEIISKKGKGSASTISPLGGKPSGPGEDKDFDTAIETVNKFMDDKIKIRKVHTSGRVEEFEVAIAANPGLQQDPNSGMIGSYNVSMRMNNGPSAPMNGFFKGPLSEPVYMPNQSQIRQRYFELVGLNASGKSAQQTYMEYVESKKSRDEVRREQMSNPRGRVFG